MKPDEKRCPRCAETIKADALVCRHCGHEFSTEEVAAASVKRRREQRNGAIGCFALVAALTIGVATCSGRSESPNFVIKPDPLYGEVAYVAVQVSDVTRSGALYDYAADALARIGANSSEGKKLLPAAIRTLNVEMFGPAKRSEGNDSYLFGTYNVSDLRHAVQNGTRGDELLGLATDVVTHTPENDDIVREHCAGNSTPFCRKAVE